jgi:hypothetical protein
MRCHPLLLLAALPDGRLVDGPDLVGEVSCSSVITLPYPQRAEMPALRR